MHQTRIMHYSPGTLLLGSLLAIIAIGTGLLMLPIAQARPISFFQALFTAVSTTCVTGLLVVPVSSFTPFGQAVLLGLMQVGGLGLITFSFFLVSLFFNFGMTTKLLAGQLFDFKSWGKIKTFLALIFGVTVGIESLGAGILYTQFRPLMNHKDALFAAIFHSVSAFCNAGLTLFPHSVSSFSTNPIVLITLALLIFSGGIGFIVWYELASRIKTIILTLQKKSCSLHTFSLHTKVVLTTSLLLVCCGTLLIWGIEQSHTLAHLKPVHGLINAFFLSVSMRSAGFMTVNIMMLSHATVLLLIALMFIGASPGSTGSGIKTTSFALFVSTIRSLLHNRDDVELFGRTVPADQIYRAITVIMIASTWVILATFALLVIESGAPFFHVLLEVISAFSTCGISMGLTPQLTLAGKSIILATMIVGRVGLLSLVMVLRSKKTKHLYRYPEERVLIG